MISITKKKKKKETVLLAKELKEGEAAEVVEDGIYKGHILVKSFDRLISLTDLGSTWLQDCTLSVVRVDLEITAYK